LVEEKEKRNKSLFRPRKGGSKREIEKNFEPIKEKGRR